MIIKRLEAVSTEISPATRRGWRRHDHTGCQSPPYRRIRRCARKTDSWVRPRQVPHRPALQTSPPARYVRFLRSGCSQDGPLVIL